jgi:ribosomal-protein-alanine N-acetyltransferase
MQSFPALETRRLVLREFRPSDAPAVLDIFSREEVTRTLDLAPMTDLSQAETKVRARIRIFERSQGIRWAVILRDQGDTAVGSCGYYLLNREWHSCEIGYELHPRIWRQGIMSEALTAIIDFAYGNGFFFRLNRIQALTHTFSQPSIGLLARLGFQPEGIRREYGYWLGEFHDLCAFSLLRRNWEARPRSHSVQD